MIKKLLKLISMLMIGYSIYIVRMRPGQIFNNPILAQFKSDSNVTTEVDSDIEDVERLRKSVKKRKFGVDKSTLDKDNLRVRFKSLGGEVEVIRNSRPVAIDIGTELKFKDTVTTGKNSVAIIEFAGNSRIKLFSNSVLILGQFQHQSLSANDKQYNIFELKKGAVVTDFVNRGDMHILEMETEASTIQVQGTQFLYLYNPNKSRAQIAVLEGLVKIVGAKKETSQFVSELQGVVVKKGEAPKKPVTEGWVKKINWPKLSKGSGIDLYDPGAPEYEIEEWKKRRARAKLMPSKVKQAGGSLAEGKSKAGSLIKNVVGKVLKVSGEVAKKGAEAAKSASPVSTINETAENMQNFEQAQKDRMKALDEL